MKVFPGTMTLALIVLASAVVVTGCVTPEEPKPAGMTLEDAPAVLDLSSVLPAGFVKLDEWQALAQGVTRENLGLGPDASDLQIFRSDSPFQLVYGFLRIVEDASGQSAAARSLFDEDSIRVMVATFFDFVAAEQGFDLPEPQVTVSYPAIGIGAALAEGEIDIQDGTLTFDMLSFRSADERVFGFVHSWHLPGEQESVLSLGHEIERRITAFNR
jgi:hypothetical protein